MPPAKPKRSAHLRGLITTFVLLCLLLVAALNRQNIEDWWRLRSYDPPATVAQIATQDTMTAYARKVFYVNRPAIEDKADFKQCPAGGEKTIILGCYKGGQNGIYVLSVSDPRLDGVEQVTAAHEMLHAAYDRLSGSERSKVDAMLTDYYRHDLTDQRIKDTIDAYKQSEPLDVVNEMHSIFGTEVASLPAPLEQYYRQYFTDRQAVTGFASQYQSVFTSRTDTVRADDAKLATMKAQIDGQQADLKAQRAALDAQAAQMQAYRSSGDTGAYNAAVPGYNASVNRYNAGVDALQALVAQYNQLVTERNAIALETQQLGNELNVQAQPIGR
jgi:hypothetical protein